MIFDTDDLFEGHDRMDLLLQLKEANPAFRMTAFAVPALGPDAYWDNLPDWIELAMHGWKHPDPREAEHWTRDEAMDVLLAAPARFVEGWKSPGWQISDGTYEALVDLGWWCADQSYNDHRRPVGLRYHCEGEFGHVHTHVQNVCGNGLEETFPYLLRRVREAESFELVSEVVRPWTPSGQGGLTDLDAILASDNPFPTLHAAVKAAVDARQNREELLAVLEDARQRFEGVGRDDKADVIADVMDCLTDWAGPKARIGAGVRFS